MSFERLIAVVGSSGTGKTTMVSEVFDKSQVIVSHTSRQKREGEVDGLDYYFVSKDKMLEMKKNDEFYEFVEFGGNLYGFSKAEFENKLTKRECACILTYDGLETILSYDHFKEVTLPVFLFANKEKVERNLRTRDGDNYTKRLSLYEEETNNNMAMYKSLGDAKYLDVSTLSKDEAVAQFKKLIECE